MPCSINCPHTNDLLNEIIELQKEINRLRKKIYQLQHEEKHEENDVSYEKACLDTVDDE